MGDRVEMDISFEADSGGFISQECPTCTRRFKIQPSKGSLNPISHCPFCEHAGADCWWTPEQAAYVESIAVNGPLAPHLDRLERAFDALRGGLIQVTAHVERPPLLSAPPERDDEMPSETQFACCGETIRHDQSTKPVHCIICGGTADAA